MPEEGVWVRGCTFILYVCISICKCQRVMFKTLWVSAHAVSAAWGDRPRIQAWQCDWIQWESQWSNKYLSVSSAPWGFCAQPTGPGPALPVQSRWKVRRGGIWGWRKASELQTLSATVKVTAAKQAAMDGWMRVWEVFELIWKHQM